MGFWTLRELSQQEMVIAHPSAVKGKPTACDVPACQGARGRSGSQCAVQRSTGGAASEV
jgi:hypothetical protein